MPIDLTKLKALELPTKEIEVDILGEKQKVKVTCPGDDVAVKVATLYEQKGDSCELTVAVTKIFVSACLPELGGDEIDMLIAKDFAAASKIAAAGQKLFRDFAKSKKKASEELEKNLSAAESPNGKKR